MDTFIRDHLPPAELWPERDFSGVPELAYPERLNCVRALLDTWIEKGRGDAPVLHFGDTTWSYAELQERVNRIARVLVEDLGIAPGNRVLLRAPNNPMLVACWLAVAKAGAVVVATMPLLRHHELAYIIDKARIDTALCDAALIDELEKAKAETDRLKTLLTFSNDGSGDEALERAWADKPAHFDAAETAAEDPVLVAFTSGTTGQPKGTVHFHRDILAMCDTFARYTARIEPHEIFTGSPPVAFTFGLGALIAFPMRFGASTVLVEKFGPTTMLETIDRYGVTGIYTAPTAYRAMLANVGDYSLKSLTKCVSAGEHLPKPTWEAWHEATGIKIIDGIGSTEMLHIFISAAGNEIRPGATGKAVPGYRARIVDKRGDPLPVGEEGWLAVQGPTGCRYLDNPDKQRAYVKQGWNITGDIYRMDEEGYFWYVARGDDMIISSGYNISGPEVENCLLAHPKVAECGVVAAPDPERGSIVKAYVVLRDPGDANEATVSELQAFVKQEIAPYKYPRAIEFRDALPRTQTGKLQRFKLREEAQQTAAEGNA
ncbi:MAG: benzoate-CoA ligase family protein [Gammaproteobacteria bacterium]